MASWSIGSMGRRQCRSSAEASSRTGPVSTTPKGACSWLETATRIAESAVPPSSRRSPSDIAPMPTPSSSAGSVVFHVPDQASASTAIRAPFLDEKALSCRPSCKFMATFDPFKAFSAAIGGLESGHWPFAAISSLMPATDRRSSDGSGRSSR